jgi:hypothetical protein
LTTIVKLPAGKGGAFGARAGQESSRVLPASAIFQNLASLLDYKNGGSTERIEGFDLFFRSKPSGKCKSWQDMLISFFEAGNAPFTMAPDSHIWMNCNGT